MPSRKSRSAPRREGHLPRHRGRRQRCLRAPSTCLELDVNELQRAECTSRQIHWKSGRVAVFLGPPCWVQGGDGSGGVDGWRVVCDVASWFSHFGSLGRRDGCSQPLCCVISGDRRFVVGFSEFGFLCMSSINQSCVDENEGDRKYNQKRKC